VAETCLSWHGPTNSGRQLSSQTSPLLIEGEDAATYDEPLTQMLAAVKPVDVIDEMLIVDVASLEWEVLRWRRLKWTLVQATGLKALEHFLVEQLEANYALHEEHFERYLAEILRNNPPEDQADSVEVLAAECAPNTEEAGTKLDEVLGSIGLNSGTVLDDARAQKAKELLQQYVRREPDAMTLIDELLTDAGTSMDVFMAGALAAKLDDIERIDRLSTIAEDRRNAHLTEIERRRAVFGATLRRSVQEIEDGEFRVIEAKPAQGQDTA